MGSRDKVYIFKKEIGIFIVAEQSDVREYTCRQKQSALDPVFCSLQLAQRIPHDEVSYDTSEEKREEVRASCRVKVEGSQNKPDLR